MNDRELFVARMGQLSLAPAERSSLLADMDRIVRKNQNRPPMGGADGSFSAQQWLHARDLVAAIRGLDGEWVRAAHSLSKDNSFLDDGSGAPGPVDAFVDDDLPF